ncbi:leucine-rich repeat domain-containing protein [Flavobacterium adhaerens]|uniref:leucine-rich repeat domain-containing protein n=1 Tax=Flavobacterium adhaerens TaxID=3149043 RepID=UPI0032B40634
MKELILTDIAVVPEEVFKQTDLEKLTISNSTLAIPASITKLERLKELRFVGNSNLSVPVEILSLSKTFIFFERNKPEDIQLVGQIIFDFQRKKISEAQAKVFLMLLQEQEFDVVPEIDQVIAALDYRVKEVQTNALTKLNAVFPMVETISAKEQICILGNTEAFTSVEIKPRLKKLDLNLQNTINEKTKVVVLAKEPKLKSPLFNVPITTEENFYNWINKVDKLLLSEKTEKNENAINNVVAMLNSANPANVALAFQMMKTNGVSNELLAELLIFINTSKDKTFVRTAKTLFKKYGPKDFIEFIESNKSRYNNSLEFYSSDEKVYDWLEQHTDLDVMYIVQRLSKSTYFKRSESQQKMIILKNRITNDSLDLSDLELDEFPQELKQFASLKKLYLVDSKGNSKIRFREIPDFIGTLVHLELLDFYFLSFYDLPDSISNLTSLKYLGLPYFNNFPEVVSTLTSLEVLEIDIELLEELPESLQALTNLKQLIVTGYNFEDIDYKSIWQQKQAFLPKECQVLFQDSHKRWSV